ncbi:MULTISPECIES: serine/threonine-protein kinase [Fischerella]|uniref:non-specific serine/threonine protein kinase n=1 Tax=Fischerella muscicola CCMEE 5323 TaxID=2019572 RepID=A0A2N6K3A0_FISMU|nr:MULTISPECIES: serine/threonine-protein kinase [Fischerella]MBD2431273.1 serine/threonine protein kinase [Fischerella sp. FACHB-380]PLZ89967.1 serine/threonine protein kinase [Fischerella muscicola CCMEE 5323]
MLGTTLRGRYEIIKELGKGWFAETYLAKDKDLPGNPYCVVKRLKPKSTDPFILQTAKRLFEQEAQVLYQLGNHEQIPRLLAHFQENEDFYLVQEFIEGNVLNLELKTGSKWSEEKVIDFLEDVLNILKYVHQQNVIHRDIKPANLIRRATDNKLVLIDFGAVKQISALAANLQGKTIAIGTPGYMPCEQNSGQPKFNSDIYAVGLIAIQALTGILPDHLPRHPDTNKILWRGLINIKHIKPQLIDILDRMVSYDFRDRYQSASEVLQAIADIKSTKKWRLSKKFAKPLLLLASILFIAVLATPQIIQIFNPQEQYSPADIEFSIYENPSYSVRIKYPQSWKLQQIGDPFTGDVVKFWPRSRGSTNKLTAEVNINVENLKEPTSLVEYTNLSVNEIVQFLNNARIHDSHPTKLSNLPAHEVIYSGKEEGYNIKRLTIWTLKNNQVYIITYTAEESEYDKYLEIAQTMINSLTIY